jgi:hypothetical protein
MLPAARRKHIGMIDEPGNSECRIAGETDAAGAGKGWESAQEGRRRPARAIELGQALDNVLIQSWRLQKSRQGKGD